MIETRVTYTLEHGGKFYIIEHVPARVCQETGEQLFAPETVERGSSGIRLSQTTHESASVPPIEFQQLLGCVRGLVTEARRRSEETGQRFGNDAIVKDG